MPKKFTKNLHVAINNIIITIILSLILVLLALNHLNIQLFLIDKCNPNQTISQSTNSDIDTTVDFPQIFESIEHLKNKKDSQFKPNILISRNRNAKFVLGIPTIKRDNVTYLETMLDSLLLALNPSEKNQVLIVILLAEIKDKRYNKDTLKFLKVKYKRDIQNGVIDIISAPNDYYPNENRDVKDDIFNDKPERIKWRVKQNFDICFLMAYSRNRAAYYLQLEDDIVSLAGFLSEINRHLLTLGNKKWLMIEYSPLGFIGKLFQTSDLSLFINVFMMFSSYKPVDMLHDVVFTTMTCDLTKDWNNCAQKVDKIKYKYSSSLFQHIGLQSSLSGKIQKLKDKSFKEKYVYENHHNPSAKCFTNMLVYSDYKIENCYNRFSYFWAQNPRLNDTIVCKFDKPLALRSYFIKSGMADHPADLIPVDSTFEIKSSIMEKNNQVIDPKSYKFKTNDNFYVIDFFNLNGIVKGKIDSNVFGLINEFRIRITQNTQNWVILHEISIFN